ncbi:hypothetical protein NHH82_18665 [Oxalobacteraceae bacterium OTU3REALA1]|nr:hypothetical protein NHH82_18665 [Oxalobacteraceae bacterium OTU3REALA1]
MNAKIIVGAVALLFSAATFAGQSYRECVSSFEPTRHSNELELATNTLSFNIIGVFASVRKTNDFNAAVEAACGPLLTPAERAERDRERQSHVESRRQDRWRK